jgi:hypothetical protein
MREGDSSCNDLSLPFVQSGSSMTATTQMTFMWDLNR